MGIYVNPNEALLRMSFNSKIYVDKSMILHELNQMLNTEDRFICVARPRRFGKTMAGNMISAYYSKKANSRPILEKLKIAQTPYFETYLNAFNVIKFDVNGFYSKSNHNEDIVPLFTAKIRRDLKREFPECGLEDSDLLPDCIEKIYGDTGEQFVVIMDEYDVLVREQVKASIFDPYLSFLNSMFKNADIAPAFALVYLTGVLPIVRDKIQSKLNLFTEYTMTNSRQLTEFVGFTEEETQALCEKYHLDFEECKRWYNGYKMTYHGESFELYNPKSVVQAMQDSMPENYESVIITAGDIRMAVNRVPIRLNGQCIIRYGQVQLYIGIGQLQRDILKKHRHVCPCSGKAHAENNNQKKQTIFTHTFIPFKTGQIARNQ